MDHVILFRNTLNNRVGFVTEDDCESILVFPTFAEALNAVGTVPILRAYPYQIVALDDLPAKRGDA